MAKIFRTAVAFGLLTLSTGCANPQAERALAARDALVGMPAAQLVSCAGVPMRSRVDGPLEFMTFRTERVEGMTTFGVSGSTRGATGFAGGFAIPLGGDVRVSSCEATVTLRDGIVQQVTYSTPQGTGTSRFAQCAPIFQTCLETIPGR